MSHGSVHLLITTWIAYSGGWGISVYCSGIGTEAGWPVEPDNYCFRATKPSIQTTNSATLTDRTGLFGTSGIVLASVTAVGKPFITAFDISPYVGLYKQYDAYGCQVVRKHTADVPDSLNFKAGEWGQFGYLDSTGEHVLSIGYTFRVRVTINNTSEGTSVVDVDFDENTHKLSLGWHRGTYKRIVLHVDLREAIIDNVIAKGILLRHDSYTSKIEFITIVNKGTSSEYESSGVLMNGLQLYSDNNASFLT